MIAKQILSNSRGNFMRKFGMCLILGLSPFVSMALEAQALTWDQCVQETAHNNAAIKAAYQSWQSATSQVSATKSAFLPAVSGSFSVNYGKNTANPAAKADDSYAASLIVSQNILNGWADEARVEQSKATASIAEATLKISKAQTSYDLKTAYASLVYAQRATRLQENIQQRRKTNLDLVGLRFDNGSENKGSVLLSQAYLQQADFNIIQARNSIQVASAQLARALGRDETALLTVTEVIPVTPIPTSPDYRTLAVQTPQRVQAVFREQSADSGIKLAKAGYFPTVGVSGTYGRQGDVMFPRDDAWSVGITVNVPIFNGGRDYYTTQSAIATRSAVGSSREDLDRQLITTLSTALTRLVEAKKNLEVTESFLKASEMRAEIGRGRYNNGLLSFDDWDLIETDLINRQQNYISSERDFVLAEANWENVLGTGSLK
ncbi:MAG: TolC family protein [Chitinophagaceae bacterium]|nr:TolC family protein [Oligoflexus sp.]